MRRAPALVPALLAAVAAASGARFRVPDATTPLSFPRDHGSHDEARVEWWYVTGHLETASGRRLGYQLTFFRTGLLDEPREARSSRLAPRDLHLAHFARTDVAAKTFRYAERLHRSGLGAAEAREDRLAVVNEEWSLEEIGGRFILRARDGDESLSLLLEPARAPVLHGTNGLSRKGPEPEAVSRYVSFTRMKTSGWVSNGPTSEVVTGSSWMDHEWGPGSIGKGAAGWDWFSVQLSDGRDLMLYRIRSKDGAGSRFSSGTLVAEDGKARPLSADDFSIETAATWKSPRSGGVYPARWRLRVPGASLDLDVVPLVADQELVTEKSTRVTYWEGACAVSTPEGRPAGRAYVELTGYAGEGALGLFR
jgi:predicted secreted hydrolase